MIILISIHLMLLLYPYLNNLSCPFAHFNTSNVTVIHHCQILIRQWYYYFNTSNVTVILHLCLIHTTGLVISIHLMLLLYFHASQLPALCAHFITSNVTVIRRNQSRSLNRVADFNTSNVTVIRPKSSTIKSSCVFQYI